MKFKNLTTVVALGVIGVIGSTMAFFTSTDAVTNRINAASIGIKIVEENYDNLASHIVLPSVLTDKDPKIENTGECPIYVFISVTIPTADVRTMDLTYAAGDTEKLSPTGFEVNLNLDKNLFNYAYIDGGTAYANNPNWTLMTEHSLGQHTYLYAYTGGTGNMKAVDVDGETEVVFNKVSLIDNLYAWNERELEVLAYSKLKTEDEKTAWLENHTFYTREKIDGLVNNLSYKSNEEKAAREYFLLSDEEKADWLAVHTDYTEESLQKIMNNKYGEYIVDKNEYIQVQAYAVQSKDIGNITTPEDVWEFINNQ